MKLIAGLVWVAAAMTGCEKCLTLSEHNFDYLFLIEQNICGGDLDCERSLRDITLRFFAKFGGVSPCAEVPMPDCTAVSSKACSDLVGEFCRRKPDPVKPDIPIEDNDFNRIMSLRGSLKRLTTEANEVEKQLKDEISKERMKYQSALDRLATLQNPV